MVAEQQQHSKAMMAPFQSIMQDMMATMFKQMMEMVTTLPPNC